VPVDYGGFCASQVEWFNARFGHDRIAEFFGVPCRSAGVRLEQTWSDARQLFPRETLPENTDIDVIVKLGDDIGMQSTPSCPGGVLPASKNIDFVGLGDLGGKTNRCASGKDHGRAPTTMPNTVVFRRCEA